MSAYWWALIGLIVVSVGIVLTVWCTSRQGRGEHAHYDPAFSVSAVAVRIVRESVVTNRADIVITGERTQCQRSTGPRPPGPPFPTSPRGAPKSV